MAGEVWDPPTDSALTSGQVGLSAQMLAIRDMPAALAARAAAKRIQGSPAYLPQGPGARPHAQSPAPFWPGLRTYG